MGGTSLPGFSHPQQAVYLLGAEDSGLPNAIVARCHAVVTVPSVPLSASTSPGPAPSSCTTVPSNVAWPVIFPVNDHD